MVRRDIVVVGASAGGVEALSQLVHRLPADFPAAVFVVLHVSPHGTSLLPSILTRNGPLPARHVADGEPIRPGTIVVAPPDFHLLLEPDRVRLSRGPRENGHRPAVDVLFRTAARSFGPRVIGVVLSGSLDDGAAGLAAIQSRGGLALVQEPDDSLYPGMPRSALESVRADHCEPVVELAGTLSRLVQEEVRMADDDPTTDAMKLESAIAALDLGAIREEQRPGIVSGFGCPDCGGALWELRDGELVRYRCRVGHAWTAHSLVAEQAQAVESALWSALRALEERAELCGRIAERLGRRGANATESRFAAQAREARRRAAILRQVLIADEATNAEPSPDAPGAAEPGEVATDG
ncbi:MAG TPA: chemotaxis protein CheB [Isosphaeraceae bacterium]|jgi:two-component system chemotaxis response regulator CheB|nr:chemotaxis protein CheB [Isosphaeraceae bacterium]